MATTWAGEENGNAKTPAANQSTASSKTIVVTPRILAGPGTPDIVHDALQLAGWHATDDELGQAHRHSPDGLLYLGFLPETRGPLWVIRAFPEPERRGSNSEWKGDCVWQATFGDATPPEAVLAVIREVTAPGGYRRDPSDAHLGRVTSE